MPGSTFRRCLVFIQCADVGRYEGELQPLFVLCSAVRHLLPEADSAARLSIGRGLFAFSECELDRVGHPYFDRAAVLNSRFESAFQCRAGGGVIQ